MLREVEHHMSIIRRDKNNYLQGLDDVISLYAVCFNYDHRQ